MKFHLHQKTVYRSQYRLLKIKSIIPFGLKRKNRQARRFFLCRVKLTKKAYAGGIENVRTFDDLSPDQKHAC